MNLTVHEVRSLGGALQIVGVTTLVLEIRKARRTGDLPPKTAFRQVVERAWAGVKGLLRGAETEKKLATDQGQGADTSGKAHPIASEEGMGVEERLTQHALKLAVRLRRVGREKLSTASPPWPH